MHNISPFCEPLSFDVHRWLDLISFDLPYEFYAYFHMNFSSFAEVLDELLLLLCHTMLYFHMNFSTFATKVLWPYFILNFALPYKFFPPLYDTILLLISIWIFCVSYELFSPLCWRDCPDYFASIIQPKLVLTLFYMLYPWNNESDCITENF